MARTTRKNPLTRSERLRIIAAAIAAVLLLSAAGACWYFRDRLFRPGTAVVSAAQTRTQASFDFEPGSGQSFAAVGKLLAVVTNSGYALCSPDGTALCSESASLRSPAVVAASDYAAFFDMDGQTLYFADADGSLSSYDCGGSLVSVRCSASGHLAVVSRQAGWRALVTVLDPDHEPVYRWYSSDSYVLSASVSPDGRRLAVLCPGGSGSEVKLFLLTSEDPLAAFSVSDTILLDACWLGSDRLCALSATGALFFGTDGQWVGAYDLGGRYLTLYDAGSRFVCLALSPYRSGSDATVVTLDGDGKELSATECAGEILSLDASGSEFLILNTGSAVLYGANGSKRGTLSDVSGFKQALIRSRGEALLLAAGFAEVYKF